MASLTELQLSTNLKLNNRIALAPLTRGRAGETRQANDIMLEYYLQRSSAGLLITEGTFISDQAIGWNDAPGIFTPEQTASWKSLISQFNNKNTQPGGTPFFIQLWHTGRSSHSSFHADNSLPVAPSAIPISGLVHTREGKLPYETPHELTVEEIKKIIVDYKKAAENAKEAGFSGVEIHSANGYLLDSFLQSKTNKRNDEYGGSFENRFRIVKEVLEAVLEVFPSDRVGIRFSPNGVYNDMGSPDFRESFIYYIQQVNQYRLAYLHVLDGLAFGFHQLGEQFTLKDVRKNYSGVVMGNCGYDFESANNAIQSGDADLISFGRAFISNPDLVDRFANGWPLNDPAPASAYYSSTGPEGYTDFSSYPHTKL